MTNYYFEELMGDFHCNTVKNMAFGAVGEFPYSAQLYNGGDTPCIVVRFGVEGPLDSLLALLRKDPLDYISIHGLQTADGLPVLEAEVSPPTDFYLKSTLHSLFHFAKTSFTTHGLTPPALCPLCHTPQCDAFAFLEDAYRPTHAVCVKNRLQLPPQDKTQPSQVTGHYITGVLGALLGAILGMLPLIAQVVSQGKLTTPLYAFIPLLSALLFRLLRGKANRTFSALCVLFASLGAVYLMEVFLYWVILSSNTGRLIGLWESTLLYFTSHGIQQTIRETFFTLLFILVGFFPSTVILRRYAAGGTIGGKTIRGLDFVTKSLHLIVEPEVQGE